MCVVKEPLINSAAHLHTSALSSRRRQILDVALATPAVCLLAEPSKSQVRRTQVIGQRLVCENVPRMQARSAPHDWLTLTAIGTAHLCKSGQLHFYQRFLYLLSPGTKVRQDGGRIVIEKDGQRLRSLRPQEIDCVVQNCRKMTCAATLD